MGRPLNKKYFGNKNSPFTDFQGSTNPDSGLGGSVASVTLGTLGSYTTRPTVTFSGPTLVGGVTATGTVTSEALSATVSAGGSGFAVGDLLNVTTAGGSAIAYVASVDAGNSNAILTVNFTGTGASRGSFTSLGAVTTTVNTSTAGTGTLTLVVTYRAKAVVITDPGSGYTSAADAAPTFTQSVTGTSVLSVAQNARAIKAFATVTGGTRQAADIIKQSNDRSYKVETADGVEVCRLRTDGLSGDKTMDITAFDSAGGEYWVLKLTSRKAVVVQKGVGGGTQFATGSSVPWTLDAATLDYSVKIDNA